MLRHLVALRHMFTKSHNPNRLSGREMMDEALRRLREEPFPGRSAFAEMQNVGILTGAEFVGRSTILGRVSLDAQETVAAHIHADYCKEVPRGAAALSLCMLRYDALRLILDTQRETPRMNNVARWAEVKRIVEGMNDIFREYPEMKTRFMHPYTDSLRTIYTIDGNDVNYRHAL